MTPEEIASRREQLEEKLAALYYQERAVQGDLEALKKECKHPSMVSSVRTGSGFCPACGFLG